MPVKHFVSFLNISISLYSSIGGGCRNFCCFKLQLFSINWISVVSIFNLGKLLTSQFFISSLFWFYNLIPLEFQGTVWFTLIQQTFLGFIALYEKQIKYTYLFHWQTFIQHLLYARNCSKGFTNFYSQQLLKYYYYSYDINEAAKAQTS